VPVRANAVLEPSRDRPVARLRHGSRVLPGVRVEQGKFLTRLPFGRRRASRSIPTSTWPGPRRNAARHARPSRARPQRRHARHRRLIDRLEYFLGFIGLPRWWPAGWRVRGGQRLCRRPQAGDRDAEGAGRRGGLIRDTYLAQIALLALLGVVIGLAVGARRR
jgi:predicted lysophospholipase L1 biosynthesis ABC-type transport system permease subunit